MSALLWAHTRLRPYRIFFGVSKPLPQFPSHPRLEESQSQPRGIPEGLPGYFPWPLLPSPPGTSTQTVPDRRRCSLRQCVSGPQNISRLHLTNQIPHWARCPAFVASLQNHSTSHDGSTGILPVPGRAGSPSYHTEVRELCGASPGEQEDPGGTGVLTCAA